MIKKVNQEEFDKLLAEEKPVVCDFYADWCMPCKMLAGVLDGLAASMGDKATFVKVNIDENPVLAARYGIMSIPYVAVFRGGEEVDKSIGFMPETEAREFLESNLN